MLYRWRAALLKVRDPTLDSQACLEAELEAMHAAASLDVVTDGWFSEWRARSGMPTPDCSWSDVEDDEQADEPAKSSLDERRVIGELLGDVARSIRNVSSIAGLRFITDYPAHLLLRRPRRDP